MKRNIALLAFALAAHAQTAVHIYTSEDLEVAAEKLGKKHARFADQDLGRYGNHYTLLAVREGTGSAELHTHEADLFVVVSGEATLLTGGRIAKPQTQKAGEIRGSSIVGADRHTLRAGDIVHIPANTPHQLVVENGKPFTYFVLKVTGQ